MSSRDFLFFLYFNCFVDKNLTFGVLIPLTASIANAAPLIEKGASVHMHPQLKDN